MRSGERLDPVKHLEEVGVESTWKTEPPTTNRPPRGHFVVMMSTMLGEPARRRIEERASLGISRLECQDREQFLVRLLEPALLAGQFGELLAPSDLIGLPQQGFPVRLQGLRRPSTPIPR